MHFSTRLCRYFCLILLLVQNDFGPTKSFWLGPSHFGQVQIRLLWTNFYNLDLSKIILVQNNWYSTKIIWTFQNHFWPIEGQGISIYELWRMLICEWKSFWKKKNNLLIMTLLPLNSRFYGFSKQFCLQTSSFFSVLRNPLYRK